MSALIERTRPGQITAPTRWRHELAERSAQNGARMSERLHADPSPMQFYGALRAIRDVLREYPDAYVVNEGANSLDFARNVIDMRVPRHRLDSGTWGVMGIGMGYAIAAAVEGGAPVVAIEGDSAFGFSGMELETICRYRLPVVVVVLNNGGVYRGDGTNTVSTDPAPTNLMPHARHDRLIEAFGGKGYHVTTPAQVTIALAGALMSGGPALIDCVIDPSDGTESGHLTHLNPVGVGTR
jgi:oxalyl-CoA decarboxylase